MMTIKAAFKPQHNDYLKKPKSDVFVVITYNMFEELQKAKEFEGKFPKRKHYLMNSEKDAKSDSLEYEFEIDYPYGTYELEIMWDSPKGKTDEDLNL